MVPNSVFNVDWREVMSIHFFNKMVGTIENKIKIHKIKYLPQCMTFFW